MAMNVSPNNEQFLNDLVASGQFPSQDEALTAAVRLLQQQTARDGSAEGEILPPEPWRREFDRITESRTGGNPRMDDSRESIYGDRGL